MTKRTTPQINFASCKRRHIQANFTGGAITSDGGVLLLRDMGYMPAVKFFVCLDLE